STLFDCTNNVFSDVTRKPFVDRGNFGTQTLKFVDRHRTNLKKRPCKKVLYTFLGRCEFNTVSSRTCRVLQRSLCQELKQRSSRTGDRSSNRGNNLFGLSHRRSCCNLMSSCGINIEKVTLNTRSIH